MLWRISLRGAHRGGCTSPACKRNAFYTNSFVVRCNESRPEVREHHPAADPSSDSHSKEGCCDYCKRSRRVSAKDARLYAKFTLDFPDHPKIMPLSDAAFRCLIEAILWSRSQMTDGFLPSKLATARWARGVLDELATNDPENPSLTECENGWQIRDFTAHQDSKAEVEERRQRISDIRKEAGRKGGLAKAAKQRAAQAKQTSSKGRSKKVAKPSAETETETLISTNVVGSSLKETPTELTLVSDANEIASRSTRRTSKRRTIPDGWMPSERERERSRERYPNVDLRRELERFINFHQGKGSLFADFDAAWRTWLGNVQQFSANGTNGKQVRGADRKIGEWDELRQRMTNQPNIIEGAIEQ